MSHTPPTDEVLDLEQLSAAGRQPPPDHRHFRIKVDLAYFTVHQPTITGAAILALAGKQPPDRYELKQRFRHHEAAVIGLDQIVDLTAPGIERFTTMPKGIHDGILRRQFDLAAEDVAALDALGFPWEAIRDPTGLWVLIHDVPTPEGYDPRVVSIAVRMEPGYPRTALDMAYLYPAVRLLSGRAIPNTDAQQPIDGRSWQRWSRHYGPEQPWRPDVDRLVTHLVCARAWLDRELCR